MKKYAVTHKEVGTAFLMANSPEHAKDLVRPHLALTLNRVVEDDEISVEESEERKRGSDE